MAEEHFWECRNSGGASAPSAAASGGAWVHVPPQEKTGDGRIWLGFIPSSLPRRR